jgi:hypothetical protein
MPPSSRDAIAANLYRGGTRTGAFASARAELANPEMIKRMAQAHLRLVRAADGAADPGKMFVELVAQELSAFPHLSERDRTAFVEAYLAALRADLSEDHASRNVVGHRGWRGSFLLGFLAELLGFSLAGACVLYVVLLGARTG